MLDHLSDEQLSAYGLTEAALPAVEEHLATCLLCRQRLETTRRMVDELAIRRRSEPTPTGLARYAQLFDQVQRSPAGLQGLLQRVRAHLQWDSRQQPALQGVRSAARSEHRLLYTTPMVDVEILVTRSATQFDLDGELVPQDAEAWTGPTLIQLQAQAAPVALYETEVTADGRFRFVQVPPNHYTMLITPDHGALLEIEGLDFA
jgi:hypothetical protein